MSLTDMNLPQYPKFHSMEHLRRIAEAMKFYGDQKKWFYYHTLYLSSKTEQVMFQEDEGPFEFFGILEQISRG